jgi:hypothetical protein
LSGSAWLSPRTIAIYGAGASGFAFQAYVFFWLLGASVVRSCHFGVSYVLALARLVYTIGASLYVSMVLCHEDDDGTNEQEGRRTVCISYRYHLCCNISDGCSLGNVGDTGLGTIVGTAAGLD